MDLIKVFYQFPDNESCLEHLEKVRWGDTPRCPHCSSDKIVPKADGGRVGRWNCHECKSSFNVLSKTIFQKTRIPLQKWFLVIALMRNLEESLSSCQLARDLALNQKSAWNMKNRILEEMADPESFLHRIIEIDEVCRIPEDPSEPRQSADKFPNVNAADRHAEVDARPASKVIV